MKVFISWSGERSQAVAELLSNWLRCVIQSVQPWVSSQDIDRGALWFSAIGDQLKDVSVGIVCLSKENKSKPWILFEAGALAKGLSSQSRVCTFLIDLNPTDVENPLAQFNHTLADRDGLFKLVSTLNVAGPQPLLDQKILNQAFETYWPKFEKDFKRILETTPAAPPTEQRSEDSILSEILQTTRALTQRMSGLENQLLNGIDHPASWAEGDFVRAMEANSPPEDRFFANRFIDSEKSASHYQRSLDQMLRKSAKASLDELRAEELRFRSDEQRNKKNSPKKPAI